jgi:hypothetical protein
MIPSKIFLEENTLKKSLTRVFEFGIYRIERLLYHSIPLLDWIGETRWTGNLVSRVLSAGDRHFAKTCV